MPLPILSWRRWRIAGPIAIALIALVVVSLIRPERGETLGPLGMMVGMSVAGVLLWRRSKDLSSKERRAWRYMAIGVGLAATGVALTGVLVAAGVTVPAFGVLDLFFVGTYTALVLAVTLLARAESDGRDWSLTLLDAFIGGVALVALLWTAFEERLVDSFSRALGWELVIALLYPIIDVVAIVALMILVLRRSVFRWDVRLLFLALTLGFQFAADLSYLQGGLGNSFLDAEPYWPFFLLSTLGALLTAALVDVTPRLREYPERSTPLLALMWPYLLAFALLITHLVRYHQVSEGRAIGLDGLVLIGAIALVRQLVVIHKHRNQLEVQRSELVASVSHELRTPLTAIVGYLAILEEDDYLSDDIRQEMLADASDQARHMARLVSDLMLLAKGLDNLVPLEITTTTVSKLIHDALTGVPDASIDLDIDDSTVRVDGGRIRQALVNMLTNAGKYGGCRILARTRVRHERTLVIEVHDNGRGVPTRFENMIWNRFERGANRLDSATPGMGIGLAILRAVAESHGGSASYRRSEPLGGACFTLVIPGCVIARPVKLRV